jgi:hypothetical protein
MTAAVPRSALRGCASGHGRASKSRENSCAREVTSEAVSVAPSRVRASSQIAPRVGSGSGAGLPSLDAGILKPTNRRGLT